MREPPAAGLCVACRHQRLVPNTRGSVFSLCRRSREDPSFPRYPRLPVLECRGYEPGVRGHYESRANDPSSPDAGGRGGDPR